MEKEAEAISQNSQDKVARNWLIYKKIYNDNFSFLPEEV